jgi:diketogulonate reductase-like aldo/keto reductase
MGAFEGSLRNLGLDYVDLYLVHWPVRGKVVPTWMEMEKIYASGKTRAIGVSNHIVHHLEEILQHSSVVPAINQMELHPYLSQTEVVDYCKQKGIIPEAWSSLGSTKIPLLENEVLKDIAGKYGKSVAQIILRWNIERKIVVIPKSAHADRQKENIDIFDFELSSEDVALINSINKNHRTGIHPDDMDFTTF